MIQTQQFEGFPVFGDNSTKSQPEAAVYSNGFAPADVLPAEYYNWLTNKASVGITDLNRGVASVEEELNNVVTAGGEEPTEETSNQVITAIKYLIAQAKKEAILEAHPVGSLYWSSKNTPPSQLFGGTWTQIKDKFILAAGDTYINGATGGAATVTLTTNQIPSHTHTGPSHTHSFTPSGTIGGGEHTHTGPSHTHSFTPSGTIGGGEHTHTGPSHTHSFTPSGTIAGGEHTHTGPSHTHSYTPVGTIGGGEHTHTGPSHTHSFTPSGTIGGGEHTHTGPSHTHSYTPVGNITGGEHTHAGPSHTHSFSANNTHNHTIGKDSGNETYRYAGLTSGGPRIMRREGSGNGYWQTDNQTITISGTTVAGGTGDTGKATPIMTFIGTLSSTAAAGTGVTGKATPSMTFTGTAGTTVAGGTGATGKATPSMTFTGTLSSTAAAGTGDTGKTTPSMTFTGKAGTTVASGTGATGATGGGSSHNNMPPYIVKYCWERTA